MRYLCSLKPSMKGFFYVSYTVASMFSLHSGYALSLFLEGPFSYSIASVFSLPSGYVLSMFLEGLLLCFVYGCVYVQFTFLLCSIYVPCRATSTFRKRFHLYSVYIPVMFCLCSIEGPLLCFVYGSVYVQSTFWLGSVYVP